MYTYILNVLLGFFTFLHPIICSARLSMEKSPDPQQVTNITLALILGWLISFFDTLFVSHSFTLGSLYLLARTVFCMYLSHPSLLGALKIHETFLAPLFDAYAPSVDDLVVQHIDAMAKSGVKDYTIEMGMSLFNNVFRTDGIACELLGPMTASAVPKVSPQQRGSRQHEDDLDKLSAIASKTTRR
ncbi:unnamed protein product [Phytomonas sp. Hart1]|nr:unnamed protein product [Phytomonas sp. Hart1]|eukprot:CCW70058.1 unnamed protein product [Phytomonas sp. isolate Hart1]